jgi:signal transduction histidine kinase
VIALGLFLGAAAGAAAAWFWRGRRERALQESFAELERGVRAWAAGDLAATLDAKALGARGDLAALFEQARDEQFKRLGERRKEASRERVRLELLVRHIPDGLILCDLRGTVLHLNQAAAEILGIKGENQLDAANTMECRMKVQSILKGKTQSDLVELTRQRVGAIITSTYRVGVTMFSAPNNEDIMVMVLLRDCTAERSLDAMKEEFFEAVAHDLRAPLFAMQGYLRLLEKSIRPDKHQKGYFDAIAQSCEKLTLFIQDTLDSARIEAGQMRLGVMPIDPAVLLQRARDLFQPIAEEKGISLKLSLPVEPIASVDLDERLMERVFYNLLSNALTHTPRGGAITLGLSHSGPDLVDLSVADTGPGFPTEERKRIFEKFRQLGASRSGFGLGLNICRKIVELHQGDIWADSEPGKGSRFIVRIPIKHSPKGETHAAVKNA